MCLMAYDSRLKFKNEEKVTKLAKSTTQTYQKLADQEVYKLGTSRRTEILKKIGDTGEPFEKRFTDYLSGL